MTVWLSLLLILNCLKGEVKVQKPKNVQIPLVVFNDIVDLLHHLGDYPQLQHDIKLCELYHKLDAAIRQKRKTMLFRETYSEIIQATDDSSKDAARKNYVATRKIYNN